MQRLIRYLIEKYFSEELYHAKRCAYDDAKQRSLLAFADSAIQRSKLEVVELKRENEILQRKIRDKGKLGYVI